MIFQMSSYALRYWIEGLHLTQFNIEKVAVCLDKGTQMQITICL